MTTPEPTPLIFDSDGCIVACDALWWCLSSNAVDVIAVSAAPGVVSAARGAENFARVLHAAGRRDIPLLCGVEDKLGPAPLLPPATFVHGEDGLGNTQMPPAPFEPASEPAHEVLIRIVRERSGGVHVLSTGPFGNIARALRSDPDFVHHVRALTVQGMAAQMPGNATAVANFNMAFDPTAGAEMVSARWPVAQSMVGMDVSYVATLTDLEYGVLQERRTPPARFMAEPFAFYRAAVAPSFAPGEFTSMDTLCAMTVVHPELIEWEELPVEIDNAGGPAWGMSVVDLRARQLARVPEDQLEFARTHLIGGRQLWNVALGVDVERFRALVREFWGTTA